MYCVKFNIDPIIETAHIVDFMIGNKIIYVINIEFNNKHYRKDEQDNVIHQR